MRPLHPLAHANRRIAPIQRSTRARRCFADYEDAFWGVCFFPGVTEFGEAWLLVFLGFAVVFCCGGCFACHRASLYRVWLIVCLTIDSSID